jgi:hypothetical protein
VATIADGVAVRVPVPAALEWMSEFVDDMVLIDDAQLREAVRIALAAHNLTSWSISAPDACFDTARSVTCMAATSAGPVPLGQAQALGQRGGQDQAGVGDQALCVKPDVVVCDDAFTGRVLLRCEDVGVDNRHSRNSGTPVRRLSRPARSYLIGGSRLKPKFENGLILS